jgi:hypothetical protein
MRSLACADKAEPALRQFKSKTWAAAERVARRLAENDTVTFNKWLGLPAGATP